MSWYWMAGALALALLAWFSVEKRRRRTHPVTGGLHLEISLPYTDEYELYSNPFSHCSRKTRIVFAELGLPFRHIPINLVETGNYETISAHYLKVNPSGLVPTLVHKGHPVYESDDILTYAVAQAGPEAPPLVPHDAAAHATMEAWVRRGNIASGDPLKHIETSAGACMAALTVPLFAATIQFIPFRRLLPGFLFHPNKERPAFFALAKTIGLRGLVALPPVRTLQRRARDTMERHLTEMLGQLATSGGPWIMGGQYTLADVSWTCILLRLDESGWLSYFVEQRGLRALADYFERARSRPSYATAITRLSHPIVEKATAALKVTVREPGIAAMLYG